MHYILGPSKCGFWPLFYCGSMILYIHTLFELQNLMSVSLHRSDNSNCNLMPNVTNILFVSGCYQLALVNVGVNL